MIAPPAAPDDLAGNQWTPDRTEGRGGLEG